MLVYCGGALAVGAVLTGVVYFLLSRLKKIKLKTQLEKEYGEE